MGLVQDFQNLINEHGSASILKERIVLFKEKVIQLEKESGKLQEALSELEAENAKLRKELEKYRTAQDFLEHRGALFKRDPSGGYHETVYCPSCRLPMFSLESTMPYHCSLCNLFLDFTGQDLPKILKKING